MHGEPVPKVLLAEAGGHIDTLIVELGKEQRDTPHIAETLCRVRQTLLRVFEIILGDDTAYHPYLMALREDCEGSIALDETSGCRGLHLSAISMLHRGDTPKKTAPQVAATSGIYELAQYYRQVYNRLFCVIYRKFPLPKAKYPREICFIAHPPVFNKQDIQIEVGQIMSRLEKLSEWIRQQETFSVGQQSSIVTELIGIHDALYTHFAFLTLGLNTPNVGSPFQVVYDDMAVCGTRLLEAMTCPGEKFAPIIAPLVARMTDYAKRMGVAIARKDHKAMIPKSYTALPGVADIPDKDAPQGKLSELLRIIDPDNILGESSILPKKTGTMGQVDDFCFKLHSYDRESATEEENCQLASEFFMVWFHTYRELLRTKSTHPNDFEDIEQNETTADSFSFELCLYAIQHFTVTGIIDGFRDLLSQMQITYMTMIHPDYTMPERDKLSTLLSLHLTEREPLNQSQIPDILSELNIASSLLTGANRGTKQGVQSNERALIISTLISAIVRGNRWLRTLYERASLHADTPKTPKNSSLPYQQISIGGKQYHDVAIDISDPGSPLSIALYQFLDRGIGKNDLLSSIEELIGLYRHIQAHSLQKSTN